MSYKQKPESFKSDCEFRIVAVKLGEVCKELCKFRDVDGVLEPKCKFIEINFGKKLSYLRRI